MKTEAEIRQYLNALKIARVAPCACKGDELIKCREAGTAMGVSAAILLWVLGENKEHDKVAAGLVQWANYGTL